jgi:alpha-mannosidase
MMSLIHEADNMHQAVQQKIASLSAVTAIPSWRYHQGPIQGAAEQPGFDDTGWDTVTLMKTWSSADGEAWFRTSVNPPMLVEGISLAGTTMDLEVFLAIGATVYVNGVERFHEDFWTDSRAVLLRLTDNYQPGEPMTLAVRCKAGDGFGLFLLAGLRFGVLSDRIFELDLVRSQLNFTNFLISGGAAREGIESTRPTAGGPPDAIHAEGVKTDPQLIESWSRAAGKLDLNTLAQNDWDRWQASVSAMRADLSPFTELAKSYQADLIAHSHIDMNWLWPWRETVEVCRRDFTAVDRLMSNYPEFQFSQSMASTYAAMEQQHPEVYVRIRERVREGRWEVTANTWVEGDLNMAAGETLVRQILHTRRYIASHFGVHPLICWEPDTFGHTANYPQILAKSGIKYYYFCRAGMRHPLFWWQGIDGSRVLAVQDPRGYGGENNPSDVVGSVIDFAGRYGVHRGLYVYGAGDHGGGATARDIEMARRIDNAPFVPYAKPSSSVAFYERVSSESPQLPVVQGEMNTVFEGCYTSHGDIKGMNRDAENSLLTAESMATLAAEWAEYHYPLQELADAWRTLCFHQFHDILCGCAISVTYREARERMDQVLKAAQTVTHDALQALADVTNTGAGDGLRIAVTNPLGWERTDVVRIPLQSLGGQVPVALVDETGRHLPVQASGGELIFIAQDVPACGMRVYKPVLEPVTSALKVDNAKTIIDNGILRLHVNPASGSIDSLLDLEVNRDLAGPWAGWGPEAKVNSGMINRMQVLWEQPHPMSAWNIGDITRADHLITDAEVRMVEQGPVRAVIEVWRHIMHSHITQRIVTYAGLRRIDFETEVDWHEKGSAHSDAPMLRATFAPFLSQPKATFEVAFAGIERQADGREVPALRWADLSAPDYGLAVLNNGKYGYQAQGSTLGLTLVRASYEPDNNPDEGLHKFTYSLYPHPGDWQKANVERQGTELNQPLQAVVTDGHKGKVRSGAAWVRIGAKNVALSALKLAEDQPENESAVILRVFETHGKPARTQFRVAWALSKVEEVDLNEQPIHELSVTAGGIRITLGAHEIKTYKLYIKRKG